MSRLSRIDASLVTAARAGDAAALDRLMRDFVTPLYAFRARRRGYEVTVMKVMMELVGLAAGPVRPPLPALRAEETAELKKMLERWKDWL